MVDWSSCLNRQYFRYMGLINSKRIKLWSPRLYSAHQKLSKKKKPIYNENKIKQEDHMPCPGVIIGDCGSKSGLEGIDNGFLQFKNVKIPYDNLLDRFSQIENGEFKTEIKNPDKRFGLQLGSLSGGRVIISLQACVNAISALTIGIRYACIRQQFGLPGKPEYPIIEYPLVQYRLLTSLAKVIVMQVASLSLNMLWDDNQLHLLDKKKNNLIEELHAKSSVVKAQASWMAAEIIQNCREILGGHGYSSLNRLSQLYRDNDINTTWEGDNTVLLQQTAKFLLDIVRQILKGQEILHKTAQFITLQPVDEQKWSANDVSKFKQKNIIIEALEWRVNLLLQRSGLKLQENLQNQNTFDAWNDTQVFYLNNVSLAFGDLYQAQEFIEGINKIKDQNTIQVLDLVFELWALDIIQKDQGTFRENNFINIEQTGQIKQRIIELLKLIKPEAVGLIDVLAPPDHILGSPFGAYDGDIYNKYLGHIKGNKNTFQRVNWWKEIHDQE
ncbi:hypothetical protein IMG5_073500 [Ichthyophthirius multifiliis]|uniref:Uncharacterized protein n=1 Tax=Ichthyophthirius multifiliis TaxID=5932 RepID=G0QQ01_ICHMU|nr:hypothetical protein IMG5_073500 [Ichthyophthirius multifiliis]EGR32700.1 hypothetical protein IMG5_073500 [Ichthyophthirius multifiliis]|eukprot:XP_004036686.1 hypothetical protein IMG5_073500 [Ichthyophthirius multifiliis]